MKIAGFTSAAGKMIGIPVSVITGFCEVHEGATLQGNTFIATGPLLVCKETGNPPRRILSRKVCDE